VRRPPPDLGAHQQPRGRIFLRASHPLHAELPKALGCADWYTARVTTLGELDEAMKAARASKSGAYIEIISGKMDMPPALAYAHGRLKAMYGETP
jgi:indolepyruvate decarboxylase